MSIPLLESKLLIFHREILGSRFGHCAFATNIVVIGQ